MLNNIIIPLIILDVGLPIYNTCLKYFASLLLILVMLHIYWYYLIVKMFISLILYNKSNDIHEKSG